MQNHLSLLSLLERFWSKVERGEECWRWIASVNTNGYGQLFLAKEPGSRPIAAHRLSWMLHYGPPPAGAHVLHRCDNRRCVRPDHLFLGSNDDNIADMTAKGRAVLPPVRHGERNGSSKLNAEQVRLIRDSYSRGHSIRSLARSYGVSKSTMQAVVRGASWQHVS